MSDDEKYYRADWMTDEQWECAQMLADLAGGFHHCDKIKEFGSGIETNRAGELATFDFDGLTRAVVMAHDRAIRFAVSSSGPGRIKLILHKRKREGSISQRHPDRSALVPKVYEICDCSNEEMYFTVGVFPTLETAVAAIEKDGPDLCFENGEDLIRLVVRERVMEKTCWSHPGKAVYEREWIEKYNEDTDEYEYTPRKGPKS